MNDDVERRIEMASVLSDIKATLKSNTEMTKDLHRVIMGNGNEGVVTKVALNKQSIARIWKTIAAVPTTIIFVLGTLKYFGAI